MIRALNISRGLNFSEWQHRFPWGCVIPDRLRQGPSGPHVQPWSLSPFYVVHNLKWTAHTLLLFKTTSFSPPFSLLSFEEAWPEECAPLSNVVYNSHCLKTFPAHEHKCFRALLLYYHLICFYLTHFYHFLFVFFYSTISWRCIEPPFIQQRIILL